jgi:hypothetical protein
VAMTYAGDERGQAWRLGARICFADTEGEVRGAQLPNRGEMGRLMRDGEYKNKAGPGPPCLNPNIFRPQPNMC